METAISKRKRHKTHGLSISSLSGAGGSGSINSSNNKRNQFDLARARSLRVRIDERSRKLTICLISLIAAIATLSPSITYIHLTRSIGLFIFETNLIQLKSSLYSVIFSLVFLVIFFSFIHIVSKSLSIDNRCRLAQRSGKYLIGIFASISAISYLSIVLLIKPIKQIQRMPMATFDCNANLITIENCQQLHSPFSRSFQGEEIIKAMKEILWLNYDQDDEKLIERLNCINFDNKKSYGDPMVERETPTRFLLHQCSLVCRPQRQQVHQFNDDLNLDQASDLTNINKNNQQTRVDGHKRPATATSSRQLIPPYLNEPYSISTEDQNVKTGQVSLKVCFSDEFNSGSAYKRFCVTNLANGPDKEKSLTLTQLNAMLKRYVQIEADIPTVNGLDGTLSNVDNHQTVNYSGDHSSEQVATMKLQDSHSDVEDEELKHQTRSTHYVNPFVQFESHFKGLQSNVINDTIISSATSQDASWCKFKPIPPFIVNNRPFNNIQCSIEHQYTLTTIPDSMADNNNDRGDKIFLRRQTRQAEWSESNSRERCNIQCRVNILYQIHRVKSVDNKISSVRAKDKSEHQSTLEDIHYYLPLRPCIIVRDQELKQKTLQHYMYLRSLGDSSLVIVIILLDMIFLMESIDTKQGQFEGKKYRLIGLLAALTLSPLVSGLVFDLIASWPTDYSNQAFNEHNQESSYIDNLLNDRVMPTMVELVKSLLSALRYSNLMETTNSGSKNVNFTKSQESLGNSDSTNSFLVPFFIYSVFMLILALNSFALPVFNTSSKLVRVSSSEELGMVGRSEEKKCQGLELIKKTIDRKNSEQYMVKPKSSLWKSYRLFIQIALIIFLMGFQHALIHSSQVPILVDVFGDKTTIVQSAGNQGSHEVRLLPFIFSTHLSAIIPVLLACLVFHNELSRFVSSFSPFNTTASASSSPNHSLLIRSRFLKYISISLIIYTIRSYVLANIGAELSNLKHLMVTLFQIAEIFNFPLTWFVITTYIHSLQNENDVLKDCDKHDCNSESKLRYNPNHFDPKLEDTKHFKRVLLQASLAILYFVIAKSITLFIHSLFASINLHSDNFDWFISSYYQGSKQRKVQTKASSKTNKPLPPGLLNTKENLDLQSSQINATRPESLFSPLPTDRQTYLHASRQFLRYNAVLCLCIGIIILASFLLIKYRIWNEVRRRKRLKQRQRQEQQQRQSKDRSETVESFDERLNRDLMRIHASPTRTIHPASSTTNLNQIDRLGSQDESSEEPRARVLFHYDTTGSNLNSSSSSESGDSGGSQLHRLDSLASESSSEKPPNDDDQFDEEVRIPIEFDCKSTSESLETHEKEETKYISEQGEVSSSHLKSKRIRIYEDEECWSPVPMESQDVSRREEDSNEGSDLRDESLGETDEAEISNQKRRTITFAPTAILIAESSDGMESTSDSQTQRASGHYSGHYACRASPEPSIDYESDD